MRVPQQQSIAISMSCNNIYIKLLTYVKLYVTLIIRTHIIDLMSFLQCRTVLKILTLGDFDFKS